MSWNSPGSPGNAPAMRFAGRVDDLFLKLGVSLTPVRGPIQQLAPEGLVEIRTRGGTFGANLTPRDVEETFRIRGALGWLAAGDAGPKLSPRDIGRLKELVRAPRRPLRSPEAGRALERANSAFHQVLVHAAGNRRLEEMGDTLNAHLKIARVHASGRDWPARLHEEPLEHEATVAAPEAGDVPRLQAAPRQHLYRAKDALMAALKARLEPAEPAVK